MKVLLQNQRCASMTAVMLALALPVHAAEDVFSLSLEELINVPVTIAARSEERAPEAASSVTVFTREQIRRLGVVSLEELLNYVPGVQSNRTQDEIAGYTPAIRGRRGGHGTSPGILLMFDGRRMNSPVFGGAFHAPLNNLDWVKQVEVIRGPGSTIYGANAFHGVINVVTDFSSDAVTLRAGGFGSVDASVTAGRDWGDWSAAVYVHHHEDDGEQYDAFYNYLGDFRDTQDPLTRSTAALKLGYRDWTLDAYYSDATQDDWLLGSTTGNGINTVSYDTRSLRLQYAGLGAENWSAKVYLDYLTQTDDASITILPAPVAQAVWWSDGSDVAAVGGNYRRWQTEQFAVDGWWQLNAAHRLSSGMEFRVEQVDRNPFQGNWDPVAMEESRGTVLLPCDCTSRGFYFGGQLSDLLPESDRWVANAWVQDQWQWRESVALTLGMRWDEYEDFGGHASFRASAVVDIDERNLVKLIYGDAFRAPSLLETRALIASNTIGNPELEPETISTLDLVWQRKWRNLSLVSTWSHSWLEDGIERVQYPEGVSLGIIPFRPENVGSGELDSLEVELTGTLGEHWTARVNGSRLFKTLGDGQADTLASFSVTYAKQNLSWSLGGFYHGEVLSRPQGAGQGEAIALDSLWHLNMRGSLKLGDGWQASLVLNNLLDDQYRTFSSAQGGLEFGLPNRGRLALLELRWTP